MTMDKNGSFRIVRAKDFPPYHRHQNRAEISQTAFSYNTQLGKAFKARCWHPSPTVIIPTTPAPITLEQGLPYPANKELVRAHDNKLDQLDATKPIHWMSPYFLPPTKLLLITIGNINKWTTGFQLLKRKSRGSLRANLMTPFFHYDPEHLSTPMASKSSVRILFSLTSHQ